jgi:hypothetical protein
MQSNFGTVPPIKDDAKLEPPSMSPVRRPSWPAVKFIISPCRNEMHYLNSNSSRHDREVFVLFKHAVISTTLTELQATRSNSDLVFQNGILNPSKCYFYSSAADARKIKLNLW